jgi:hypothetical protein
MKPTNIEKIASLQESDRKAQVKIESFEEVLQSMEGVDPQKLQLWLEIYNNASNDRANASALLTQGFTLLGQTSADHMSLGPTLVKYLERMTKSNDQLLALAQLVAKEVEAKAAFDTEDIFTKIEGK